MGCFLGCFGFSSKRTRGKQADRVLSGGQVRKLCSYEPFKTASENLQDLEEETIVSSTCETRNVVRKKKVVRFNLNVKTYEPIPKEEYKDHAGEIDDKEEKCSEISEECHSSSSTKEESIVPKMESFPSNHRYQNFIDNYDEEDEIAYHDSNLDDEEEEHDDDDVDDDYDDDSDEDEDEYAIEEHIEEFSTAQVVDEKSNIYMPLCCSNDEESKLPGMNLPSRNRRQYVHSVLKPVQNATQWKAMKARAITPPMKRQRKENIPLDEQTERQLSSMPTSAKSLPLIQDFEVDASLSNWLVFSDSNHPKTTNFTKDDWLFDASSLRCREDMPVLDITNFKSW